MSVRPPRGAVLLLTVLMLAGLSLLAVVGATDALLQLRMARQDGSSDASRVEAESALRWAEAWLLSRPGDVRPIPCASACSHSDAIRVKGFHGPAPELEPAGWWTQHALPDGLEPGTGQQAPGRPGGARWLLEELHHAAPTVGTELSVYRVLARSDEGTPPAVLESLVARPWGDPAWQDALPGEDSADGPPAASFCHRLDPPTACGRLAWQQRQ